MSSKRKQPCGTEPEPGGIDEFVRGADRWMSGLSESSRRQFLRRMAAAIALAGLGTAGCSDRPEGESLVARTESDQNRTAGRSMSYATAMSLNGYGRGVLVTSRDGRPIKIEGNPDHPSSLGGTDVFMQASILDLYDPTRLQEPARGGTPTDWPAFFRELDGRVAALSKTAGAGLRILSGLITSPTLLAQIDSLEKRFPQAHWHSYDPLARQKVMAGATLSFGRPLEPVYDLRRAKVICAFDADVLFDDPGSPAYARQFADARRVRADHKAMNRLYVVESTFSLTGAMADHRLPRRPSEVGDLVFALLAALNARGGTRPAASVWIDAVADDLRAHRGESLVLVGESQPPEVHAAAAAINASLGNVGQTIRYIEPLAFGAADESRSLAALVHSMKAGEVNTLLILGGDPAYTGPAGLGFADALAALSEAKSGSPLTVYLGPRSNATARRCQWQLPETHYLEQWGDLRAHDGTVSIIQPLINPLYVGKSAHALVDRLLGNADRSDYDLVREQWRKTLGGDFDRKWADALKAGIVDDSAAPTASVSMPKFPTRSTSPTPAGWQVAFRPDPSAWDGAFAHNAWLQELPRPFTKIVWDNAALMSPSSAFTLGVAFGDMIRLTVNGRSVDAPVALLPGVADQTIVLHVGYGQTPGESGQTPIDPGILGGGETVGFDAYPLAPSGSSFITGVAVSKIDGRHNLVQTRSHHAMGGADESGVLAPNAIATPQTPKEELEHGNRKIIRAATLAEFAANPDVIHDLGGEKAKKPLLSLYPGWDYSKGYQWGMSIDLTTCIGCNACVVACQAENNIPVVGKELVDRQREMHWLRIDDYFDATHVESPTVHHQPVPCMHCENAPCEVVCPVGATTHSVEGLNQMIYNRCVGTRYCNNNCPYKVRRFNFLDYTRPVRESPQRQLQQNPDVTVRSRGVMEKCSYCIQRLEHTKIDVERVVLELRERARKASDAALKTRLENEAKRREFEMIGSIQTACQQACPTRAIDFGSILPVAGEKMSVIEKKAQPHNYVLLEELTTKPRTSYLGRLRNPNPALRESTEASA